MGDVEQCGSGISGEVEQWDSETVGKWISGEV